jgi:hypothetical protein
MTVDATVVRGLVRGNAAVRGVTHVTQVLDLAVGDLVEVRSTEEILATLDDNGELDAMPFMPEMLQFVGQRFQVYKRAHKTCDTATRTGGRSLNHTVHLKTRCDGSGHGGCQAGCLIFWKEAWLKRSPNSDTAPRQANSTPPANSAETLYQLQRAGRRADPAEPDVVIYSCQATQVPKSTAPLTWWDPRQYARDVRSGNVGVRKAAFVLGRAAINAFQRWRGGRSFPPFPTPTKTKTPKETLDLKPGELVQVKSAAEIADTLDVNSRNRGLYFDVELIRWCGGTFRVQSRVGRIINERTGRMIHLPNECIILEGVACQAECSRGRLLCPREIHHYWREIWLRRVVPTEHHQVVPTPRNEDSGNSAHAR